MSTESNGLNILVYCHIYDNKYKTSETGSHESVFLFLYNGETYNSTELNEDGLDNLKQKNIHVKFLDIYSLGEDDYQKKYIEQLNDIQFDYIFPIHCPFGGSSAPTEALELLKPTGKYMYNDYRITGKEEFLNKLDKEKYIDKEEYIKEKRELLDELIKEKKGKSNVTTIAFHKYKETKEPYVYLTDIDEGVGWFDIYTRELLEQAPPLPEAQAQADAPPTPPLQSPKSAGFKTTIIQPIHSRAGCFSWGSSCWTGGTRRKKILNRTKSIKKKKRSKKRKNRSVFRKKSLHLRATS